MPRLCVGPLTTMNHMAIATVRIRAASLSNKKMAKEEKRSKSLTTLKSDAR